MANSERPRRLEATAKREHRGPQDDYRQRKKARTATAKTVRLVVIEWTASVVSHVKKNEKEKKDKTVMETFLWLRCSHQFVTPQQRHCWLNPDRPAADRMPVQSRLGTSRNRQVTNSFENTPRNYRMFG